MTDGKPSLKLKAKPTSFEVTAQGWEALLALLLIVALVAFGLAMGWWQISASGR
jgi:hypothetical protein